MSRIDAVVATQVPDVARPVQTDRDVQLQSQQAQQVANAQSAEGQQTVDSDDLRAAASQLRQVVEAASGRRLKFDIDEKSKMSYVQITDLATGETIKQIPSKEVMALHARLDELIGLFVNKKA